jgi:hypothetical protein
MDILFGRNRAKTVEKEPEVSPTFAQEVLDLEIEFNFNPRLNNLQQLMSLYSQGIEFYESLKNPKFNYYKNKLQELLSRPQVKAILTPPEEKVLKRVPSLQFDRTCEKTLQTHVVETQSLSKLIKQNVKVQADSLTNRLENRKKLRTLQRKKSEISPFDRSAGPDPVEIFESEVEEIMERYAELKAKVKNEVEEAYQEHLSELQDCQDIILVKLFEQMKKNMKGEIEGKIRSLDEKKTAEIAKAREKLSRFS